ncbi:ComEC/Rec2 family competence protein [Aneurinibacillus sp. REN35]
MVPLGCVPNGEVAPSHQTNTSHTAGELEVHYLDIGQGDSIYIKTPAGEDILIDGGKNAAGKRVVNALKSYGVEDIEMLISTHPDSDHVGGLDDVLKAFPVKAVYAPKVAHTTETYMDFLQAVKAEGVRITSAKAGVILPLQDVTAAFVGPVKEYASTDLNDWSAVLHLTYGTTSFLFTGDAEIKAEKNMVATKQPIQADVIKVGHHGARTSTSAVFIKAVQPTYAIISVGKNSYGHPHPEITNRLKAEKITTLRTDQKGTITAMSDGKTISFTTER